MNRLMVSWLMAVLFFGFVPTSMAEPWGWDQPTTDQDFHMTDPISCFGMCGAPTGTTFELRVFVNGTQKYLDSGLSGNMQWSKTAQPPTGGWPLGSGADTKCTITAIGDPNPTYPQGTFRNIDII